MKKVIITLILVPFLAVGVLAQTSISTYTKSDASNSIYGSKTNSISLNQSSPKIPQSGSKVMQLNESFNTVSTLTAGGWNIQNLSTTIGTTTWMQGSTTVCTAYEGADTAFAACNFNSTTGANTISNWLITPMLNITNGDVLTFWSRTVPTPSFPDRLQVRMSTNGASTNVGANATSVGDFTTLLLDINPTLTTAGYPNVWTLYTITISGVTGTVTGKIAFRYFVTNGGPSGANSDYICLDLVQYNTPVAGTYDASITTSGIQYPTMPLSQTSAMSFTGNISNVGPTAFTNAVMTSRINNGVSNIWTGSSAAIASMAVGANQNVTTTTSWTPIVGTFTLHDSVSITEVDLDPANNLVIIPFSISDSILARDNGLADEGCLGIGDSGSLGSLFDVYAADQLTSVSFYLGSSTVNPSGWGRLKVVIYDYNGVTPNNLLYKSPFYYMTAITPGWHNVVLATPLNVTPGQYYVGLLEDTTTLVLARSTENYTPQTSWLYYSTQTWITTDNFAPTFNGNYLLHPNFGPGPVVSVNDVDAKYINVYPNPTSDMVYISNAVNGKLFVRDLVGNLVYSNIIDSDNYGINVSSYAKGMYFLQIDNQVYKVIVK